MADFKPLRNIVDVNAQDDSDWTPLRNISVGKNPPRNALAAGLSSGTDVVQGLGYSVLGGAADLAGLDTARDWANEQARRNAIDASINGRPDLENIEDQTLGSALPYLGYQITKQAPIMAGLTAAQFVPGLNTAVDAVGLSRLGAVLPKVVGGGGLEAGANFAARRAALEQGRMLATGTVAGSGLGFGSMYGESVEGGDPNAIKALALSPLYGAAEAVMPAVVHGGFKVPTAFAGNRAVRMLKAGGIAGAGESLTELSQGEMEMSMRNDLTPEQKYSQRLNNAAAGLFVGGVYGSSGGFADRMAAGQEANLLPNINQTSEQTTRQYGLVTQPAPLQERINQQLGIGLKPVAGKKYASQFEAAFNEPSGQYAQDPATGIERELTMGELMQRGTAPLDLTVANPADAAAAKAVATQVARDPRSAELRDTFGVVPTPKALQLYTEIAESGIPADSDILTGVWSYAAKKPISTDSQLQKARNLLDAAIIEARKGPTNVGQTTTPLSQPTTSVGTGGAIVQGGLGTAGPSITSNIQPSTGTTVTGTTTGQTQSTPTTGGQQAAPVTQGLTNGPQAPKAKQAETQGQTTTTRGAAGTTPLIDTSDDALEIARATGNAGEIEAMREDEAGLRADRTSLSEDDVNKIVGTRFAKSKNASRDAKILNAYLTAMRADPEVDKAALQNAIGDKYGIKPVTVRKIGNPTALIEAGAEHGFSAEQVMDLFSFDDNTKAQFTAIGKIESQITALRKSHAKATTPEEKTRIANEMAALSERITKMKEKASEEKSAAFSAGLQEAGVVSAEGESAGFGFDTDREWTRVEGAGQAATALTKYLNAIESAQALADQYDEQGQTEAAQAARDQIERLQAQVTSILQAVEAEKKPATTAAPDVAEARKRWNDAGRDLTKLSVEDLKVLKDYTASINNKALSAKIADEISSRGAPQETANAVQVESPTGVSVQPKTEAGQGVGQEVRSAEKPASKGEVAILTPQEQYEKVTAGFPVPAWADLTQGQQSKLTDLARRDQLNLAAVNRFVSAQVTDESNIVDVEARVVDETVTREVAKLPDARVERLEKHYGVGRNTAEFLAKVKEDVVLYASKGATAVAAAVRDVIKAIAEGVLAMAMVVNPNLAYTNFELNLPQVVTQTVEQRAAVPEVAQAHMSDGAKVTYSAVAPIAKAAKKAFMITDKADGKIHVFHADGTPIIQTAALTGRDTGDQLQGGKGITPAGKYTIRFTADAEYAGGFRYDLVETSRGGGVIAVHAVYTGEASEKRPERLNTPTAADNRISWGCINVTNEAMVDTLIPARSELNGSLMFVMPENSADIASLFPAMEKTTTTVTGDATNKDETRTVTGKEEKLMFGKDKAKPVKTPYTAEELLADIKGFVRTDIPGRKLMIVDSVNDLLSSSNETVVAVGAALKLEGAYGVAADGRAFLIADRIDKGNGRAAFMHEVGAHLGLENLLPAGLYKKLTDQLEKWVNSDEDTDEAILAARAEMRVMAANTSAEDIAAERLAYFIEEAMLAGIDPTASGKESGPLAAWFRTLWAAFKVAVRKLGFKPESLTAQDIVDLAFGAARLEVAGTFHGTAAVFRRFNHKFMGKGEGAQAYGWGSYLAQRAGIAKGYWKADVERKTGGPEAFYDGRRIEDVLAELDEKDFGSDHGWDSALTPDEQALRTVLGEIALSLSVGDTDAVRSANMRIAKANALGSGISAEAYKLASDWFDKNYSKFTVNRGKVPEGSLMRVDIGVADSDLLNWDERLATQPAIAAKLRANMSPALIEDLQEAVGDSLFDMTGEDLYRGLTHLEKTEGRVSEEFKDVEDYNKRLANKRAKQIASVYLDEIVGIPGLKFYDADSRSSNLRVQWSPTNNAWQVRTRDGYVKYSTTDEAAADKWAADNQPPRTRNIVVFNDKNIFRVGAQADARRNRMRFGKAAPDQGFIAKNISKLPKTAQQPVRNSLAALGDVMGKGLDYMVFTSDLVNRATKEGISSAKKFVDLIGQSKAEARANEIAVEKIADMYALVPEKERGTGDESVNRFLFDSTRESKWGYGQYRDPVMGARFDKLSKESQAFVEAVFAHGSTMLAAKKKLVMDSTNSEYDAMIAAAKAAGDKEMESKLLNEKKATIKRFQTLFKIRDGMPYAPIKRNGSHVVIAKSAQYLAAEAANDTKLIEKLEADSDHYHVSFTDGKWEGRTLQQELIDQGAFESVELAERDSVVDEMYSGHSALRELTKMRSRVDEQAKAGDKSANKMLSLISQMYLEALAEGSARKSEMRRRGVAGEVDMIRSFAQQGRADANFMASVKYNPQVQKALQEMRTQAKSGNRERKSELLNELVKRYIQSMDYNPRPWLNKLTRMSSIYYLATSPAYYLQNLTQPWMMSVPAMAGQHDYSAASSALFKAYTELGGVMKSAKLLKQQFDFDKVPADVRDAIKELVNRGKIDIGLDTEIGEFKVEGDGYFAGKISAADKALRLAVQKVESINRLSTAMAAYRLELARTNGDKKAATDYADRILTETHGDYTSFNAPRAFNTGAGKIALQFRKFQLIQLAFYAKLIKESLHGADRAAALKTLTYSLAHTGVLAGLMGMPGYAAISWVIGALLGDDDEPYDLTSEIRKAIGDEATANLILKGAPTLAGMDISGKVGAGNMLSIMPFSQADLSTTAGRAEAFGTLVGGATLGMTSRMIDGLGLMLGGDWYRGLEQTMPKGVADAMKAYRIANEGMTRRNGDIILPASEISTMDSLFQAIGISPVQQTVTYERQNTVKALTQNFQDRTTEIKNQYTKADRAQDAEAKAQAREAWTKLQDARVRNGLQRKPLSDLLKAPAEQRKREKETAGGVQYTKATKKLAQQYSEI